MPHGINSGGKDGNNTSVIDFNQVRTQRLDDKRRKTERIFFKHLLGVYSVTGAGESASQMRPIEVVDVSEDGCSFIVPFDAQNPWPNNLKEFPIRLYFSQDTYLPVTVKIQNSAPCIENGRKYIRYGCSIDTSMKAYATYQQFVRFLKSYSEHSHKDTGDVTVFYL